MEKAQQRRLCCRVQSLSPMDDDSSCRLTHACSSSRCVCHRACRAAARAWSHLTAIRRPRLAPHLGARGACPSQSCYQMQRFAFPSQSKRGGQALGLHECGQTTGELLVKGLAHVRASWKESLGVSASWVSSVSSWLVAPASPRGCPAARCCQASSSAMMATMMMMMTAHFDGRGGDLYCQQWLRLFWGLAVLETTQRAAGEPLKSEVGVRMEKQRACASADRPSECLQGLATPIFLAALWHTQPSGLQRGGPMEGWPLSGQTTKYGRRSTAAAQRRRSEGSWLWRRG